VKVTEINDDLLNLFNKDRSCGPCIYTLDGSEAWYRGDVVHRKGGPAITYSNGRKIYYEDGAFQGSKR